VFLFFATKPMSNVLNGKTDAEKLQDLASRTYKEQGIWFLNAYWNEREADAEKFWLYVDKFSKLDLDKKAEGSGLDEMNAHRFLESIGETKTVQELRSNLRDSGALGASERPKTVPLIHFLLFHFRQNTDWHYLVNATQGDNRAELEEAQRLLQEVNKAFADASAKADTAASALREAEKREEEARQAHAELTVALAELKSQEQAFESKTNELKRKSEDEGASVVGRNKAKNELSQHLASDPLPLRKAKITQEAAVKKAEKATAAAAHARQAAIDAKAAADAALDDAKKRVDEAQKYLDEVKRRPGQAYGALWWLQRELDNAKLFMPEKKGGLRKVDTTK